MDNLSNVHQYLFREISAESYQQHLCQHAAQGRDAEATALLSGKEAFDFARFATLYLHDTGSCESLPPDAPSHIQSFYRRMYYEGPHDETVDDFAARLNHLDACG